MILFISHICCLTIIILYDQNIVNIIENDIIILVKHEAQPLFPMITVLEILYRI